MSDLLFDFSFFTGKQNVKYSTIIGYVQVGEYVAEVDWDQIIKYC